MMGQPQNFGFMRVAAAVPVLKVGNPDFNADKILELVKEAQAKGVQFVVFPELGISGYTVADLFFQKVFQRSVFKNLEKLARASSKLKTLFVVGFPLALENKLFNAAAVIGRGKILGIVPKTYIPGYKEFYEERWFSSARELESKECELFGKRVPIGTDILFRVKNFEGAVIGIEICEDLWTPAPPSSFQALAGATLIANLSASNDLVGKAEYRKNLVSQQSARLISDYVYSSAGVHESTTDVVFGGHAIIAENGSVLTESKRFERKGELIISEIDVEHILSEREKTTSFGEPILGCAKNFRTIDVEIDIKPFGRGLARRIDPSPFVPTDNFNRNERAKEIFAIQAAGLAKRLEASGIKNMILGLSGGLDSTLALLVAVKAAELLGFNRSSILTLTMPGFGTSNRTNKNAKLLAKALGVNLSEIDISKGVTQHFKDLGYDSKNGGLVYENSQARYRTYILMNKANQIHGLVVGTGDLSEIALGWSTYNGDHISHYNVNCSVPKTLVKHLVKWIAETQVDGKTRKILEDILATPISPELKKASKGNMGHKTEDLIGPYELHDFFLYHFVRWGSSPEKILYLAGLAWGKKYSAGELKKWLGVFLDKFFRSQWKRSVATDGPKVGSVSLSPRGDWRMPSDADAKIWLESLDGE